MKLFWIYLCLVCLPFNLLATDYHFDRLNTKHGLSQNDVTNIFQDSEGFLWFCTHDGLNRYDGYEFKVFRPGIENPGMSNNRTKLISEDENGILWISTASNTIDRFDLATNRFIYHDSLSPYLSFDEPIIQISHCKQMTYITCLNSFVALDRRGAKISYQKYTNNNQESVNFNRVSCALLLNDSSSLLLNHYYQIIEVKHLSNTVSFSYFKEKGNKNVQSILPYQSGYITAGFQGVSYTDSNNITHSITDKSGSSITLDNEGYLWFGAHSGLYKFKPTTEKIPFELENHFTFGDDKTSRGGNSIKTLFKDNQGIIWIGLEGSGIAQYNPNRKKFQHYSAKDIDGSIAANNLTKIYEDRNKNIWFGTRYSGLSVLPLRNEKQFSTGFINYDQSELNLGHVKDIAELNLNGKPETFFATSDENFNIAVNPKINSSFKAILNMYTSHLKYTNVFVQDGDLVWFGIHGGGLIRYSISKDEKSSFLPQKENTDFPSLNVTDILCDSKNRIWVATDNGLCLLPEEEKYKSTPRFINFFHNPLDSTSISNNYPFTLFETSQNKIVIGTLGGGLNVYNETEGNFNRITTTQGLPNGMIKGILEDEQNNLWVSSNNGISKINLQTLNISNYDIFDGLQNNEFGPHSCCKLYDGQMIFGGVSGFNVFYPNEITSDNTPPTIVFSELQILNQSINAGEKINGRVLLHKSIDKTAQITLKHSENSFSLFFTGLYYSNPSKIKYRYKLDGFDKDWQYSNANLRFAKYTSIKPGKYTFLLNAANPDGVWNPNDKTIAIHITPPFYQSTWAYLIYCMGLILMLLAYKRYYRTKLHMQNTIEMERFEKEKIMEFSKERLQFFTNISHEFRTPLSLIKLCFEELKALLKNQSDSEKEKYFTIGQRNIDLLLRLINQLIDFRKMDQGQLSLNTVKTDLVQLGKEIFDSFKILAQKKGIHFEFKADRSQSIIELDKDKIEKVFHNLLSNAFKYTPEGKKIIFSIQHLINSVQIQVSDSGIGIAEDKQAAIFTRFYQAHKIEGLSHISSGIGLALSKEMIELHKGTISVNSKEGFGTNFRVEIPAHISSSNNEDDSSIELVYNPLNNQLRNSAPNSTLNSSGGKELKKILIAEDNDDLREFLANNLKSDFIIMEAKNGKEASELCLRHFPDLIISDVMMPQKSGLEFCREIKSHIETSHIPVVLLTAKSLDEHKIEGYEYGADAYITKPFSFEVLKMQIMAIFKLIESRHEKIKRAPRSKVQLSENSPLDRRFIKKAQESIFSNLANPDYSIELLADTCHVSTSTLIRKFKYLLGTTPKSHIRIQRLKLAEQLLIENKLSIDEIMNKTAFLDYTHFAKSFKKEYGATPKDYRK